MSRLDIARQQFEHSSLRENIIEHLLIGELLRLLWRNGITDAEVLRSEFDGYGYDLVISRGSLVRHLQLKSGTKKPSRVTVSKSLANKPSAGILYLHLTQDLQVVSYYWFGGRPHDPLVLADDLKTPKRPTHNKDGIRPERTNHLELSTKHFRPIGNLAALAECLFGEYFHE